jgi:hypothetical protein
MSGVFWPVLSLVVDCLIFVVVVVVGTRPSEQTRLAARTILPSARLGYYLRGKRECACKVAYTFLFARSNLLSSSSFSILFYVFFLYVKLQLLRYITEGRKKVKGSFPSSLYTAAIDNLSTAS